MADWPQAQGDASLYYNSLTATGNNYGVTVVAGGSINTKGSTWTELIAATPFDAVGFMLNISVNGDNAGYLLDIGVGASTVEVPILNNWCVSPSRANNVGGSYHIPLRVPKGSRLSARVQSSTASSGLIVSVILMGGGFGQDPGFGRCTTYGADTSLSGGVTVDPGGVTHTKNTWATIGASTNRTKAVIISLVTNNAAATTFIARVDVGVGASPVVVIPDLFYRVTAEYDYPCQDKIGPLPLNLPPGTVLKIRAQSNLTDGTDRLINDVTVYGFD